MTPKVHVIQGLAGGALIYPYSPADAAVFASATVLIDTDHFLEYYMATKRLDLKGLFDYHGKLVDNLDGFLGLNVFHTLELYLLIFISSFYYPVMGTVLMAFLFHHLFDQIALSYMGRPFARAFSFFEYLYRKQFYCTTLASLEAKRKAQVE